MKRRIVLILALMLMFVSINSICADIIKTDITFESVQPASQLANLLRSKIDHINDEIALRTSNKGTGDIYYVDSNAASGGAGKSWFGAKTTLNAAIALCDDNNGDIIYIASGHTEALDGSDGVDITVAGITVIGLGNGMDMPEFTYDATGDEFVIGAANVTVINVRFVAGVQNIDMAISVEDAGDDFTLYKCIFPKPTTNTFNFATAIDVASGVTDIKIIGCEYYGEEAGGDTDVDHFIDLSSAAIDGVLVANCIIRSDFKVSAIFSDDADDEVYILNNIITNLTADQHCIEFTANATGVCAYNLLYTSAVGTTLTPGYMKCFENYVTTTDNKSGTIIPVHETGLTQLNATSVAAIYSSISGLTGYGFLASTDSNADVATVDCTQLSGFGDNYFNDGWSIVCFMNKNSAGNDPEGEVRDITNYSSSLGIFTVAAFSAAVEVDDEILVIRTHHLNPHMLALSSSSNNIWYCDDGGSDGDGKTWQTAVTSLYAAQALCAAGDTIYVGKNHTEDILHTEQIDFDVAGVTVIGLGEGNDRPTITFDGDATSVITITAAGVTLRNLRFLPSINILTVGIQIAATGHGAVLDNIAFLNGELAGTDEWVDVIAVNAAATDLMVKNCTYHNTGTEGHTNTFLDLTATTVTNVTIKDCTINGYFAEAAVYWSSSAPPNLRVENNTITNGTTTIPCIAGTGVATGVCIGNRMYCDTIGNALDPGSMSCFENYVSTAINTSGHLVPTIDDGLVEMGTGRIIYCDSGLATAGDGRSWATAVKTLDAAVNLCEDDRGDTIYVAQGHTETVITDFVEIDQGGITIIGLGNGKLRPYFDFTTGAGSSMLIDNDDITIKNLWFHANISDLTYAIEVKTTSNNVTIEDCVFTAETAGDEFLVCIDIAGTSSAPTIKNCDFRMGASQAVSAIRFIESDYTEIIGNTMTGDYSTAVIHNETTASDHIVIKDNILFNGTIAGGENTEPGIELVGTTSGVIIGNSIVCLLDTAELSIVALDCYLFNNQYNSIESSNGSQEIGLVPGRTYCRSALNISLQDGDKTLFTIAGGPIKITALFMIMVEDTGASCKIGFNSVPSEGAEAPMTAVGGSGLETNGNDAGDILYSVLDGSIMLLADTDGTGIPTVPSAYQIIPAGLIETDMDNTNPAAGLGDFYIQFEVFERGVTVTPS